MNLLIIYAHPNPNSFNASLRDLAVRALSQAGHSILLSDLYKVQRADLLLFQFPDWWYGMPAIMKSWIDRVFAYGFA